MCINYFDLDLCQIHCKTRLYSFSVIEFNYTLYHRNEFRNQCGNPAVIEILTFLLSYINPLHKCPILMKCSTLIFWFTACLNLLFLFATFSVETQFVPLPTGSTLIPENRQNSPVLHKRSPGLRGYLYGNPRLGHPVQHGGNFLQMTSLR